MKLYAWKTNKTVVWLREGDFIPDSADWIGSECLGYVELESPPKKTVTKYAELIGGEPRSREIDSKGTYELSGFNYTYWVPVSAKNVKCTYE